MSKGVIHGGIAHEGYVHAGASHAAHSSFQNTNTPDIDIDRDLIIAGGIVSAEGANGKEFKFNIFTIVVSALIFLAILAWFDFMQTTFYTWLDPETQEGEPTPANKLWYACLSTCVVIVLCCLLFVYADKLKI